MMVSAQGGVPLLPSPNQIHPQPVSPSSHHHHVQHATSPTASTSASATATTATGGGSGTKKRGNLPREVTELLKSWILSHAENPYPTDEEKRALCAQTGLTYIQVSNWMINVSFSAFGGGERGEKLMILAFVHYCRCGTNVSAAWGIWYCVHLFYRLVDGCFHQRTSTNISVHRQLPLFALQAVAEVSPLVPHTVAEADPIPPRALGPLWLSDLLRSAQEQEQEGIRRRRRLHIISCHSSYLPQDHLTLFPN
jgi:Homeobox KN domain